MNTTQREAGMRTLDRLIRAYNAHDANAIAACFTNTAELRNEAWHESSAGREAIRRHYESDFMGSSDVRSDVIERFVSEASIADELVVRGTHSGAWRGLPATGNRFDLRCWVVARLSSDGNHIERMRLDYDRATILQQLGLLHDPDSLLGKTLTVLTHPVTMARAARQRMNVRQASHSA